ncbi:MAG: transketolase [Calditrichaeota bacterium]|nr:transketolase [Calditrichota bacterium]MCB9368867.1 transketolase [Calditrichota bacterium]
MSEALDRLSINTVRGLAIDAVQAANSGHPGLPLGAAAMGYAVFQKHLRHNPLDPQWVNRDRFVLSAGHGCALLYSLLHLTGYDLPMEQLKNFRQWGSITPGHPEFGMTPGVEATTGPLGQGVGNIVGIAIARDILAATFNRPGHEVINFRVFGICSDGDLMEGVSAEAASLAGHLGLGSIVMLYDDNHITIDGSTKITFTEDVGARFESYGWQVLECNGLDLEEVDQAIREGIEDTDRPTLVRCRTTIGFGSPHKAGTSKVHGSPLGEEELKLTKRELGLPEDKSFFVPTEVFKHMSAARQAGSERQTEWQSLLEKAFAATPGLQADWQQFWARRLPENWADKLPTWKPGDKPLATRKASEACLEALSDLLWMVGGSADLVESNLTYLEGRGDFQGEYRGGRNLRFGIREHGMGAVLNGIASSAPFISFGATFLNFLDYMKASVRLSALSHLPVLYVFTHDSIGLGEDGPTHQPIEHLTHMRATPNLWTMRPADANETAQCYRVALERRDGPVAFCLTRQGLPVLEYAGERMPVELGAYVLSDANDGAPVVILLASGSEVEIALGAKAQLEREGVATRVVSVPCFELFDQQPQAYRDEVLPSSVRARVAVEAGATLSWWKYVGLDGDVVGLDRFGASAPAKTIYEKLGLTPDNVARRALSVLEKTRA